MIDPLDKDTMVLNALLAKKASEHPDRPLLEVVDGPTLSYAELDELGRRWAAAFKAIGISEGDRVATMLPPGVDAYGAWLGLAWLRALDTGVNTEFKGQMLSYILSNSGARAVVIHAEWLPRLEGVLPQLSELKHIIVAGASAPLPELSVPCVTVEAILASADPITAENPPRPRDICSVTYTSGTTGPSKGVLFPWAQMYACAEGSIRHDELTESDAFYSPFPMFHGSGRMPIVMMVQCGGRVVVKSRFSGSDFWQDIRRYNCTVIALVGAMTAFLMKQAPASDDAKNPARIGMMLPLAPNYREFENRFGVKLKTVYSMTEIGPVTSSDWSPEDPSSCGRALPGCEIRLVDEDDYEVPHGEVGELMVRTDQPWKLNAGYLNLPEATAKAWRNGWFHTGDAMRRDDAGNYYFVDRIKDAIRRRGENISSFEVEAHVIAHPDISECAALAMPSEWGEDEVRVIVVTRDGVDVSPVELIEFLAERMPRFMVPRYVDFVESLPKTDATQRVRKVELRKLGITDATWDREAAGISLEL